MLLRTYSQKFNDTSAKNKAFSHSACKARFFTKWFFCQTGFQRGEVLHSHALLFLISKQIKFSCAAHKFQFFSDSQIPSRMLSNELSHVRDITLIITVNSLIEVLLQIEARKNVISWNFYWIDFHKSKIRTLNRSTCLY